MVSARVLG